MRTHPPKRRPLTSREARGDVRTDDAWDRPAAGPEFPGASPADDADLRHIVGIGSLWFAAALIGTALPLSGLLAAGWRPASLSPPAQTVWWSAAALGAVGVLALAWSGCPVIEHDTATSAHRKSLSIRAGVVLLLLGQALGLLAILTR